MEEEVRKLQERLAALRERYLKCDCHLLEYEIKKVEKKLQEIL